MLSPLFSEQIVSLLQLILVKMIDAQWNRGGAGWGLATLSSTGELVPIYGETRDELELILAEDNPAGIGIGHGRYVTSGEDGPDQQQPFLFTVGDTKYAFGFNGNLTNIAELRDNFGGLQPDVDTTALKLLLMKHIAQNTRGDMQAVLRGVYEELDGACNLVLADNEGNLYAASDTQKFHPLVYTRGAVASEDHGLKAALNVSDSDIYTLPPGHMLHMRNGEVTIAQISDKIRRAHCFFEWIYFANVESTIEEVNARLFRQRAGEVLGELDSDMPDGQIVMPVPFSAMPHAFYYKQQRHLHGHTGVRYLEGISRRITDRSFTHGTPLEVARKKLHVEDDVDLEGEDIVLVDDSLVKGNTMKALVEKIRTKNPASIHLRLACPPVKALCYYGINISDLDELTARKYLDDEGDLLPAKAAELAAEIGVDSIRFLPIDNMKQIFAEMDMAPEDLCTACITGDYPTPAGQRLYDIATGKRTD